MMEQEQEEEQEEEREEEEQQETRWVAQGGGRLTTSRKIPATENAVAHLSSLPNVLLTPHYYF